MNYVMVTRYGGLGDLVMMLPTLEALRRRYPDRKLVLRTYKDYLGYLDRHPLIDSIVLDDNRYQRFTPETGIFPIQHDNLPPFSKGDEVLHLNFQGVIENCPNLHGCSSFATAAGIDPAVLEVPPSIPTTCFDPGPRKGIVVQLRDNSDGRGLGYEDLPTALLTNPNVRWISGPLSPRDYMNAIANAETFIGPDSSGLHLAAACAVPNIFGLYPSSFPPEIRTYPNVNAFTDRETFKKGIDKFMQPSLDTTRTVAYSLSQHCPHCEAPTTSKAANSPYWQCGNCELWFQYPLPPKVFEAAEEKGSDGRSNGHNQPREDLEASAHLARCFARNWVSKVPSTRPFKKTLDVGCKYPYFAYVMRSEFQIEAYGIDGMDFDKDAEPILAEYQQELGVPMLMVDFEKVTPQQILAHTTDGDRFDAISMVHVFEHLYDAPEALRTVYQLLNPEGYFLIRVPSHEVTGMEWHMSERHYTIHPYFYSEKAMRYLVEKSGLFEIVETYPMSAGIRDYVLKPVLKG